MKDKWGRKIETKTKKKREKICCWPEFGGVAGVWTCSATGGAGGADDGLPLSWVANCVLRSVEEKERMKGK